MCLLLESAGNLRYFLAAGQETGGQKGRQMLDPTSQTGQSVLPVIKTVCWCGKPGVRRCQRCDAPLCLPHALLLDASRPKERLCASCAYDLPQGAGQAAKRGQAQTEPGEKGAEKR
jgi:hypothetical protein